MGYRLYGFFYSLWSVGTRETCLNLGNFSDKIVNQFMQNLKIHIYTLCWNEELFLPHFFRYYSFAEKIVVYDNESNDNSQKLIKQQKNAELRRYSTNNEFRDDIHQYIKNTAWKESKGLADFVIVCDLDELLYHPQLFDFLATMLKKEESILIPRGFDMICDSLPQSNIDIVSNYFRGIRNIWYDKPILFNPNLIEEINYNAGAHSCFPKGKICYARNYQAKLLHYKYLGKSYLIQRYAQYRQRLSEINKKNNWGGHYSVDNKKLESNFDYLLSIAQSVLETKPLSTIDVPILLNQARCIQNEAKDKCMLQNAIDLYEKVLEIQSDNITALNNIAVTYAQVGKINRVKPWLEKAVSLTNSPDIVWFNLGQLLTELKDYSNAEKAYEESLARACAKDRDSLIKMRENPLYFLLMPIKN
jgi:tetratricopeptide (TPR) repeat protein